MEVWEARGGRFDGWLDVPFPWVVFCLFLGAIRNSFGINVEGFQESSTIEDVGLWEDRESDEIWECSGYREQTDEGDE